MLSSLTVNVIGVLCLVLFGLFYWLSICATARAVLAFVGTCILGTVGFVGGALHAAVLWLVGLLNTGTVWAFGLAVGGMVATVVAGVVFAHDLHPKNTAGRRTGWAAIVFAALLVAGVSGIPALNGLPGTVQHAVTNTRTVLGG